MEKLDRALFDCMQEMKWRHHLIVCALLLQECKKPVIHSNIKSCTESCSGKRNFSVKRDQVGIGTGTEVNMYIY